ncbi:DUF7701 domain-containing protein [Clavibacter sp. km1a]|uniref:DUF7701 domain-containing protein n=1 Tax=Clavibacter sp. km1a TaxID=3459136 RepID=UPI004042D051
MEINYLEQIAGNIRERVAPNELPDENTRLLFRMYAVLLLAKGESVTAADVHNAWVAWMCSVNSAHESIVPYEDLAEDVASSDQPYVDAIIATARARAADAL